MPTDAASRESIAGGGGSQRPTEEEVEDFLFGLREKGIFFEDVEAERLVPDDPKDDYLVALTRASSADYLVSGDPHLVGAKNKVPVTVLTPRHFSELLESESS